MPGIFITGTDTGIGKTFVTVAMINALRAQGVRVAGMKPVGSGADRINGKLYNEDALLIKQAMGTSVDYDLINPYCFAPPVSPHIAAQQAGVEIRPAKIQQHFQQLEQTFDLVLVEGVGGWLAPLSNELTVADLAKQLCLPVIMVVGIRLGCLNHASLTAAAIRDSGMNFAGWIANDVQQDTQSAGEQLAYLRHRLRTPPLFEIKHHTTISSSTEDEQKQICLQLQNLILNVETNAQ
ncbi:MAG: dethiobiotin synthase [Gammaproteobacteria bacterium]|nr:dethiobiotin synthase [Gammaproteobacteria bacterium]MDH5653228.1 dethiobiotin synthase [Gammaproteobacteria bacterium]